VGKAVKQKGIFCKYAFEHLKTRCPEKVSYITAALLEGSEGIFAMTEQVSALTPEYNV